MKARHAGRIGLPEIARWVWAYLSAPVHYTWDGELQYYRRIGDHGGTGRRVRA